MKKTFIPLSFVVLSLVSCNKTQNNTESETMATVVEEVVVVEESSAPIAEDATSQNGVSDADKQRACSELKSWGAKDAYFDGDYLCYVVSESDITASAYEVGKAMFPMFEDVAGLKGIKVISAETKKELAVYPN